MVKGNFNIPMEASMREAGIMELCKDMENSTIVMVLLLMKVNG